MLIIERKRDFIINLSHSDFGVLGSYRTMLRYDILIRTLSCDVHDKRSDGFDDYDQRVIVTIHVARRRQVHADIGA